LQAGYENREVWRVVAGDDIRAVLDELARNFRWVWDRPTQEVFAAIGGPAWTARRDPMALVAALTQERLDQLAADPGFQESARRAYAGLTGYLAGRPPAAEVAYFCMEHGVAPNLRIYAGGLGMLAGDIEKTASDLGVPMVAVGLMYHWRVSQRLNDGWQEEDWEPVDPTAAGLEPCPDAAVTVELAGEDVRLRVWRARIGRVDLYLLDTDLPENPEHLRDITDRLYGGDTEHRLRQEIVLGIGGLRALRALGLDPTVYHANEGHAGFLGLERIRQMIQAEPPRRLDLRSAPIEQTGIPLADAVERIRHTTVFTTHTAVPAGFDLFERWLIEKYFADWAIDCGVSTDWLMALGHFPDQEPDEPFNMAVLCSKLSAHINAVSKLHREVTEQRVLGRLWPGRSAPIVAVTNGVHAATWAPAPMAALFDRYVGAGWEYAGGDRWDAVWDIPDEVLWQVRRDLRESLVGYAREYLPTVLPDADWARRILDPDALTIVVARRAAEYKETDLLTSQPDRLRNLALNPARPVNLVFAGLAHPKDGGGKERIRNIVRFSLDGDVRANVAFLPGYDMRMALWLLAGADVWLNHPRRGDEACGTSFMKSVYSGGRIASTADGGADELLVDGYNGWLIGDRTGQVPREVMAENAFGVLETSVVPEFYDRDPDGVPRRWVAGIKRSLASLAWQVGSGPMMRAYQQTYRETRH
jgi:glycogen phosphorylase